MTTYAGLPFVDVAAIRQGMAIAVRPPRRQTVTQTLREAIYFRGPGGIYERWSPDLTPYMVEPADHLTDRMTEIQVFVGPARSGKTLIIDGWVGHALAVEPADMAVVSMTQDKAREYSRVRIRRMIDNSPAVRAGLSPLPRDDNVFDKFGAAGQVIRISWPSITQLSSSEYRWVAATDVDRMDDNIDGEGDIFGILGKRTATYLSAAGQYYESSPGRPLLDPNWHPAHPHQGPPVAGIVGAYNMGDMRQWYWRCLHCRAPMRVSPDLALFGVPDPESLRDAILTEDLDALTREYSVLPCRECGAIHTQRDRRQLNLFGRWVPMGCTLTEDGRLEGPTPLPGYRSYWLGGAAAAYQPWSKLVSRYLKRVQHWAATGDEEPLKQTVTQDQGGVYRPLTLQKRRATVSQLQERVEIWTELQVPAGVRTLFAAVDVQLDRFTVQIVGYGVRKERWIIDYYNLRQPVRPGAPGIDPAVYAEDWQLLIPLLEKSYPLSDGSGRRLRIHAVACDSAGVDGVTERAYDFVRWLREYRRRLYRRFRLVKGSSSISAPRTRLTRPDTRDRKDRGASRGDVDVVQINTQALKDALSGDLARTDPGPGYIHIPKHLGAWWLQGLTRESKDERGRWGSKKRGNEPWDLLVYCEALAIRHGFEKINWAAPPGYAAPWDQNSCVILPDSGTVESDEPEVAVSDLI